MRETHSEGLLEKQLLGTFVEDEYYLIEEITLKMLLEIHLFGAF